MANQIKRSVKQLSTNGGTTASCQDGALLMGGSCFASAQDAHQIALHRASMYEHPMIPNGIWLCGWLNSSADLRPWTVTATCLDPSEIEPIGAPGSCSCPPIQPFEERVSLVVRTEKLGGEGVGSFEAVCDDAGLLIGGGCDLLGGRSGYALLSVVTQTDGVQCTWDNPIDNEVVINATATCVYPPAPGTAPEAVPLSERIVHVEKRIDLAEDSLRSEDVSCSFGDTLVWGSCGLEEPDERVRDVRLFRSGFVEATQNRPNTWQCGWNVPPGVTTARGIAKAICLRPLDAVSEP